jgi:hypothetical protein
MRNPATTAAMRAPNVTGSTHALRVACGARVAIASTLGGGAAEIEVLLAFAVARTARSAACCAA